MDAAYNAMAVHRMIFRWSCMSIPVLGELLPEGGIARGEEGVFAGVPAKEMRSLGVEAMVFAGDPDFVEQEGAGDVEGAVQVVGEAAFLAARRGDERAEFGFEQGLLAFLGAKDDDQGYSVFGEPGGCARTRLSSRCVLLCFALRHGGGDCTPTGGKEKAAQTGGKRRRVVARSRIRLSQKGCRRGRG